MMLLHSIRKSILFIFTPSESIFREAILHSSEFLYGQIVEYRIPKEKLANFVQRSWFRVHPASQAGVWITAPNELQVKTKVRNAWRSADALAFGHSNPVWRLAEASFNCKRIPKRENLSIPNASNSCAG